MNNITDALVYTQIKNNLTPLNFKQYNELLLSIGAINDKELNEILSLTTIKKGCCEAKSPFNDDTKYQTTIYKINNKVPYTKKTVRFDKSICNDINYLKNNKKCSDFNKLYCENSKYLYDRDTKKIEPWKLYSNYCKDYKFINELSDDSQKIQSTDSTLAKLLTLQSQRTSSQQSKDTQSQTEDKKTKDSNILNTSKSKYNTTQLIIVIIIIVLIIISIIASVVLIIQKNKKKSTNIQSSNESTQTIST